MLRPSYLLAALVVASAVLVARHYGGDSERETSRQLAEAALGRLHQGMPLAEAEQALDDAWHHAACPYQAAVRVSIHLFPVWEPRLVQGRDRFCSGRRARRQAGRDLLHPRKE